MNKKFLKITIISVVVLVLLIIIIFANVLKNDAGYQEGKLDGDESKLSEYDEENIVAQNVNNETMFYTVSDCVKKYIQIISYDVDSRKDMSFELDDILEVASKEEKHKAIYQLLNKQYIQKNNISINNIDKYVKDSARDLSFMAKEMMVKEYGVINVYSVYGKLIENGNYENSKDIYFKVIIDIENSTFSIEPLETEDISLDKISLDKTLDNIEKNTYNEYKYNRVSEIDLINLYMGHYKLNAINNYKEAYSYLDEQYRDKRFGSLDNYKEYVNNNKSNIISIVLDKYQRTEQGNYTQYVCIDTQGRYYIFRETATMQYTLLLDSYTIDLPEFTEKYNKSHEQQKVALNLQKFFEALNSKDYKYAYSKLADSFKNNHFATQGSFENYIKNNFPNLFTAYYIEFNVEGELHVCKASLVNVSGEDGIDKTFIMQLGQGTDFTMSFNIE